MPRSIQRQTASPASQTHKRDRRRNSSSCENCSAYQEWPTVFRRHAERAAGDVARRDERQQHDLAQRQRDQREIMADDAQAETRIADHQRQQPRRAPSPSRDAEPWRDAVEIPQQRRHIGADAQKRAVAERDQAEPAHHRPGRVDKAPDQDLDRDVQEVVRREKRQQRQENAMPPRPAMASPASSAENPLRAHEHHAR